MAEKTKRRRSGKSCAAGGPNLMSCTNTNSPGVSTHLFPSNEKVRKQWVQFVRKYRPDFVPNKTSVLCSIHFTPDCFTRRLDLTKSEGSYSGHRHLITGSIPTIHAAVNPPDEPSLTDRERRKMVKDILNSTPSTSVERSSPAVAVEVNSSEEEHVNTELPRIQDAENATEAATESPICREDNSYEIVAETPIGAERPPRPPECNKCSRLSKNIRRFQKVNSYLRKRNRQLTDQLKAARADESTESLNEDKEEEVHESNYNTHQKHSNSQEVLFSTGTEDDDEGDPDWASLEEDSTSDKDDDAKESKVRVEKSTSLECEPKFLVFHSMLLNLFSMFCFHCKAGKPKVEMRQTGTMVTVLQYCRYCEGNPFTWRSQPYHPVLGRYPAGNILLSFAVLLAGASISKVLLVFQHMGLCTYSIRTHFSHQKKFVFPSILHNWETYRAALIEQLKVTKDVVWSGDGRFDSMGHNAKYGAYTMFCSTIMKIVHFELLQANETGSSNAMELEGAKRSFSFLKRLGLSVSTFISDRHRGIAKWIRQNQSHTCHYFDIWHVARSINKKLLKASQEKGCEILKDWMKGVRNHLYWCVTSTLQGFENLILAKWKSFLRHVNNKHMDHPDALFSKCAHEDISPRKWIKIGTKAYDKLSSILSSKQLLNDIKKLSADTQTSCLEGFHATLNHWHPKMIHFSWLGTFCRHILASLHFNENLKRESKRDKDGKIYYKVTYPKFKLGEEVVQEVAIPPTYGYVDDIRKILFSVPLNDLNAIGKKYQEKIPLPLNRQFPERVTKEDAVKHKESGKRTRAELFPPEAEQSSMQNPIESHPSDELASVEPPLKKKAPCCRKCHQPMRGHPQNRCPVPVTTQDTTRN